MQSETLEAPVARSPAIRVSMPDGSEQSIPLGEGSTTIGRHPDNTLRIDDPTVSATHLTLVRIGAQIKVCDDSRYGTRLQGALLIREQPIRVHHGQSITFGGDDQGRYRLTLDDPSELPPTQPPKHAHRRVKLAAQHRRLAEALVHEYLERVSVAPHPASVEEMAERLEVHPSTIRRGLGELEGILRVDADLRGPARLHALADRILASDAHRP